MNEIKPAVLIGQLRDGRFCLTFGAERCKVQDLIDALGEVPADSVLDYLTVTYLCDADKCDGQRLADDSHEHFVATLALRDATEPRPRAATESQGRGDETLHKPADGGIITNVEIGQAYPIGHPSGRFYPEPVSVEQAQARVVDQMRHLIDNVHIGSDVGYARDMLDEAYEDYLAACFSDRRRVSAICDRCGRYALDDEYFSELPNGQTYYWLDLCEHEYEDGEEAICDCGMACPHCFTEQEWAAYPGDPAPEPDERPRLSLVR